MDVNKFIATIIFILVESHVANLETVKFKLGGRDFIIPLAGPVHVQHVNGGDLSNLRLPIPDLAEIMSIARSPPPPPPPPPPPAQPPDRRELIDPYEPSQSQTYYQDTYPPKQVYPEYKRPIDRYPPHQYPKQQSSNPYDYPAQYPQPPYNPEPVAPQNHYPSQNQRPAYANNYPKQLPPQNRYFPSNHSPSYPNRYPEQIPLRNRYPSRNQAFAYANNYPEKVSPQNRYPLRNQHVDHYPEEMPRQNRFPLPNQPPVFNDHYPEPAQHYQLPHTQNYNNPSLIQNSYPEHKPYNNGFQKQIPNHIDEYLKPQSGATTHVPIPYISHERVFVKPITNISTPHQVSSQLGSTLSLAKDASSYSVTTAPVISHSTLTSQSTPWQTKDSTISNSIPMSEKVVTSHPFTLVNDKVTRTTETVQNMTTVAPAHSTAPAMHTQEVKSEVKSIPTQYVTTSAPHLLPVTKSLVKDSESNAIVTSDTPTQSSTTGSPLQNQIMDRKVTTGTSITTETLVTYATPEVTSTSSPKRDALTSPPALNSTMKSVYNFTTSISSIQDTTNNPASLNKTIVTPVQNEMTSLPENITTSSSELDTTGVPISNSRLHDVLRDVPSTSTPKYYETTIASPVTTSIDKKTAPETLDPPQVLLLHPTSESPLLETLLDIPITWPTEQNKTTVTVNNILNSTTESIREDTKHVTMNILELKRTISTTDAVEDDKTTTVPAILAAVPAIEHNATTPVPAFISTTDIVQHDKTPGIPNQFETTRIPIFNQTLVTTVLDVLTDVPAIEHITTTSVPALISTTDSGENDKTPDVPKQYETKSIPKPNKTVVTRVPDVLANDPAIEHNTTTPEPALISTTDSGEHDKTPNVPKQYETTSLPELNAIVVTTFPDVLADVSAIDHNTSTPEPALISRTNSLENDKTPDIPKQYGTTSIPEPNEAVVITVPDVLADVPAIENNTTTPKQALVSTTDSGEHDKTPDVAKDYETTSIPEPNETLVTTVPSVLSDVLAIEHNRTTPEPALIMTTDSGEYDETPVVPKHYATTSITELNETVVTTVPDVLADVPAIENNTSTLELALIPTTDLVEHDKTPDIAKHYETTSIPEINETVVTTVSDVLADVPAIEHKATTPEPALILTTDSVEHDKTPDVSKQYETTSAPKHSETVVNIASDTLQDIPTTEHNTTTPVSALIYSTDSVPDIPTKQNTNTVEPALILSTESVEQDNMTDFPKHNEMTRTQEFDEIMATVVPDLWLHNTATPMPAEFFTTNLAEPDKTPEISKQYGTTSAPKLKETDVTIVTDLQTDFSSLEQITTPLVPTLMSTIDSVEQDKTPDVPKRYETTNSPELIETVATVVLDTLEDVPAIEHNTTTPMPPLNSPLSSEEHNKSPYITNQYETTSIPEANEPLVTTILTDIPTIEQNTNTVEPALISTTHSIEQDKMSDTLNHYKTTDTPTFYKTDVITDAPVTFSIDQIPITDTPSINSTSESVVPNTWTDMSSNQNAVEPGTTSVITEQYTTNSATANNSVTHFPEQNVPTRTPISVVPEQTRTDVPVSLDISTTESQMSTPPEVPVTSSYKRNETNNTLPQNSTRKLVVQNANPVTMTPVYTTRSKSASNTTEPQNTTARFPTPAFLVSVTNKTEISTSTEAQPSFPPLLNTTTVYNKNDTVTTRKPRRRLCKKNGKRRTHSHSGHSEKPKDGSPRIRRRRRRRTTTIAPNSTSSQNTTTTLTQYTSTLRTERL